MMRLISFALVLGFVTSNAFAALLENATATSTRQLEGVTVASAAKVTLGSEKADLSLLGAGLRTKKVLIARVKVYVLEMFADAPARFVRTTDGALASTDDLNTVALRLTFLRSVDAPTVQASFREALQANHVDLNAPALKTFLSNVSTGGDADAGKSMTIVLHKNADASETVSYEDTKGHVSTVQGGKGISRSLLAIWLGTPSDDGVATLRDQILKER